jgi:hypothetical protein
MTTLTIIPGVYDALEKQTTTGNLGWLARQSCMDAGLPRVVADHLVPESYACSAIQIAALLCISSEVRGRLLDHEQLRSFDTILQVATARWKELHMPTRTAKLLTDYLR